MRRVLAFGVVALFTASAVMADVSILDVRAARKSAKSAAAKAAMAKGAKGTKGLTPAADKSHPGRPGGATGSQALIDASGLKYFINTNITFSTTSSASGAMSEASYTHAVAASTLNGGTTSSTLNDAFDGYNTLCLSLDNSIANCETGNANFVIYNKNGVAPTTECLGAASGVNRQVVFPQQVAGNITMWRKVFVPDNDEFGRWLNYFQNTSATSQTVTAMFSNNLGSDSNTVITATSSGDLTAGTNDTWIASFQNWSGTTSSDVRLGHVLQGATNPAVPLTGVHFVNGDDNPYWGYTFTLAPGETKIIANYVVGQPTQAAVAAKASSLVTLPPNSLQCTTTAEQQEFANFAAVVPIATIPTLSETALGTLGLTLGLAAVIVLRRRRAVAA